ncbi:proline dehydrogenase family protein [Longirhabdus pacifica]|uniref:proline dehydrogenase family protein n=1 Tax=Longirhabdus pacifica TaxID=2305227 RepID=UPI0010089790|nr:proline dehydrogenase family protein [Longirhabdus pacifica]
MMITDERVENAIKLIARSADIKSHIKNDPLLYASLLKAAKRYIAGEDIASLLERGKYLTSKGYTLSLEYIGEDLLQAEECVAAKDEIVRFAGECTFDDANVSLDLSHIGLAVDPALTREHLIEILEQAQRSNMDVMISMEDSSRTDRILELYTEMSKSFRNVGITMQAHLKRTMQDMQSIMQIPGKVRVVKGVYHESDSIAYPHDEMLNERYLDIVDRLVKAEHDVSIASHDERIIDASFDRGYLDFSFVEVEMLHGMRPNLLRSVKDRGGKARVYLTYGDDWHLHVFHRLAEYPPNLYKAILDIANVQESEPETY